MKSKWLWIISGIIGGIFLIVLISLAATEKIRVLPAVIFIIIVILLIVIIDLVFWFIGRGKKDIKVPDKITKRVNKDQANKISDEMMLDKYAEYEKERPYEDIWSAGSTNTPVFVRLSKGEFTGDLFGIVINMQDPDRTGIRQYKETECDVKSIDIDLKERANLVAMSPVPSVPEQVIEEYDPLTRRSVKTRIPIKLEEDKKGELE